ncbi:MAG: hypothetical protein RR334_02535 [Clostridia bacterium]
MKNIKGIIVFIEGSSGIGKDAIIDGLIIKYPNTFKRLISFCTREMRNTESNGNPYYFVTEKDFFNKVKSGEICEYTKRHGSYRGISRKSIDEITNENLIPIKDIDKNGLLAIKKLYPNHVFGIFITAPQEEIKKRLLSRGSDNDNINERLIDYNFQESQRKYYDATAINFDLAKCIDDIYLLICEFYKNVK